MEKYQMDKLAHLGLDKYIAHKVFDEAVGYSKPDPRIFKHALSLANVRAEEAMFVGDRLDVDIAGAKAVGMQTVWFNHWGGTINDGDTPPDYMIHRLPEILDIVVFTP